ncbi:unnamed protein product [Arctia plantaginis]|uniref:Uncharacterized protein n=1 Tax=Arctia plantaginis TaxID=874455 RepID=A0A8S1BAM6_ARCPL|nr:unnamed protein product [Arctia plantaginis]CAB3253945.1 unnamed protein product [Arctia plantaginis]
MVMEERSRALVEKLKTMDGNEVNLLPYISDCTLCTICAHSFAENVIMERKKTWKAGEQTVIDEIGRLAMLDLLLEAESKQEIDLEGIREEVNTFMFERFAMLVMKCVLIGICRNFRLFPRVKGAKSLLLADILLRTTEPLFVKFVQR